MLCSLSQQPIPPLELPATQHYKVGRLAIVNASRRPTRPGAGEVVSTRAQLISRFRVHKEMGGGGVVRLKRGGHREGD